MGKSFWLAVAVTVCGVLTSCATKSDIDWWRLCQCSGVRDLNDCVVNQEPVVTGQITSSAAAGEPEGGGGGGAFASLAMFGAGVPGLGRGDAESVYGQVCLYPVEDIVVGGVPAAGGEQHLIGIVGLNSADPEAKMVSAGPVVNPVEIAGAVLTSYPELGWTIAVERTGTFLVVHGGSPHDGSGSNGVKIRLSR